MGEAIPQPGRSGLAIQAGTSEPADLLAKPEGIPKFNGLAQVLRTEHYFRGGHKTKRLSIMRSGVNSDSSVNCIQDADPIDVLFVSSDNS